jgi:hypothetical protein
MSRYITLTLGTGVVVPVAMLSSDLIATCPVPGRTPLLLRRIRFAIRSGTSTPRCTMFAPRLVSRLWRRSCGGVSSPPTMTGDACRRGFVASEGVSLRPRD